MAPPASVGFRPLTGDFAGSALRHLPVMEAHQETAGGTSAFACGMHETQAGDPLKSTQRIEEVTPLRLHLGLHAVEAVRVHAQRMLADLDSWPAWGADAGLMRAG